MTTIASEMLLAFDTSSPACTAALFQEGECIARADEIIGRGHAERLVPMIADVMQGRLANTILVGVGPGSFTGIRVAIAAAHGLGIGWGARVFGMSSLGLLAAGTCGCGQIAVAVSAGHGELFVQEFDGRTIEPLAGITSAVPSRAAALVKSELVIGSGARQLVEARGWGEARNELASAADALRLPGSLRSLAPRPVYVRAPDARVPEPA